MPTAPMRIAPDLAQAIAAMAISRARADLARAPDIKGDDYEVWLRTFFAKHFTDTLGKPQEFADFQHEFWQWSWQIQSGIHPPAFLAIWPRNTGKSTSSELVVAALAARKTRRYALYVSATQPMADDHVQNIAALIESPEFGRVYPDVATREIGKYGNIKGWRRNRLSTASGFVVDAAGLDKGLRGVKMENIRPDLIILDDIDAKDDNLNEVLKKIDTLTTTILALGSQDCAVIGVQNLIHSESIFSRLVDGRADFLTDRVISGPHPALLDFAAEMRDGRMQIIAGTPSWSGLGLEACQHLLNQIGYMAFKQECHPFGTPVYLGSGGEVPIETLVVGDYVRTHTGANKQVTEILRRDYSGCLYSIRRAYRQGVIQATKNHPFYVARRPSHRKWYPKPGCGHGDYDALKYEWANASTLRTGDFLLEPAPEASEGLQDFQCVFEFKSAKNGRPVNGQTRLYATPGVCRLVGYYLAEGNRAGNGAQFHFNAIEEEFHDDVAALARHLFHADSVKIRVSPNTDHAVEIKINSKVAADFFSGAVGTGARNKRAPWWIWGCSNDLVRELICGYWRGDGWQSERGFDMATASPLLAEDIRSLLLRLGIVAAVGKRSRITDYSDSQPMELWDIRVRGAYARKFAEIIFATCKTSDRNQAFIHNGYVHYPITRIDTDFVNDLPVCNLEVADDHSYLAAGISSHNCQHDVTARAGGMFDHLIYQRVKYQDLPPMIRTCCWVDPAVSDTDQSDAHGVQVGGMGIDGKVYKLFSWEQRASPTEALRVAIRQSIAWGCQYIGVETDQGGDTWKSVYREAWAEELKAKGIPSRTPLIPMRDGKAGASKMSKSARAQQMTTDYENGKIVHLIGGSHELLERALFRFPLTKPFDLVDVSWWVWADLTQQTGGMWGWSRFAERKLRDAKTAVPETAEPQRGRVRGMVKLNDPDEKPEIVPLTAMERARLRVQARNLAAAKELKVGRRQMHLEEVVDDDDDV